jgi:hypothetical protein
MSFSRRQLQVFAKVIHKVDSMSAAQLKGPADNDSFVRRPAMTIKAA